ncbi:MAG: mismatch repair protein MutL protein [Parcubacteria group bacterium GW2011_GWC2_39_14]|nr:MAG: mismatch repair protein MutL protein [Parcubacteria group bacterium GW2011_GWC2_39_14]KKR53291.1 MAG: mismatch repair protein MutL protein [Parcubacteria group bacterium GW2011_GWA2_40_23]
MNKIKLLSPELINQIAAGEVVERPASVVKELVENSIDAGASNIIIEIENGGLNLIRIVDNGCGMSREDAGKSILQHATSKISSQEDLFNIQSLGFRGEALASIAAVSEFSLITKDEESLAGTNLEFKNNEQTIADIGCSRGTTVIVNNLFYNIPARRKYLKTTVTEFGHIVDLFLSYCLAYPQINWKLLHHGKPVYQFQASTDVQRVADVLGREIADNLLPIDIKLNDIHLSGFIGKPQIARNNRKIQYLFINNRPVNEFIVAKQVKDAFGQLIPRDLYPVYILNLQINNEKIDVNVHPRKLEVRFSEPQIIYRTVYQAVSRTLDEQDLVKSIRADEMKRFVPVSEILSTRQDSIPVTTKFNYPNNFSQNKFSPAMNFNREVSQSIPVTIRDQEQANEFQTVGQRKIIGQIQNSYIVVETSEGMKIYDQHATSERIQYEQIIRQWEIGKLASQRMMIPQTIEMTPAEARVLSANQELLKRLGFEITEFGGQSFALSSVPQFLINQDMKKLILEIVSDIDEFPAQEDMLTSAVDRIFKMMACKSAIKFGDPLSVSGMEALINDLEKLGSQYTCVHGRPCVFALSFQELEKIFKRRT